MTVPAAAPAQPTGDGAAGRLAFGCAGTGARADAARAGVGPVALEDGQGVHGPIGVVDGDQDATLTEPDSK